MILRRLYRHSVARTNINNLTKARKGIHIDDSPAREAGDSRQAFSSIRDIIPLPPAKRTE